jgi:cytochrome P450
MNAVASTAPPTPAEPRELRTLAGPSGRFLTGHLAEVGADRLGFLTRCAREYGDFVPLRLAFTPTLLVNDPNAIEEVLVHQHRHFAKTPALKVASRVLGKGLLTSEGEFWRRQRRLIQPAFHRQRIAAYAQTMVAETNRLLESWTSGETRDVALDMMGLTMAIATKTLFGAGVDADTAQRLAPILLEIGEYLNSRMYSLLFLIPDVVPTPATKRYRRAVGELDAVIYEMIDRARRAASGEADAGAWDADAFLPMLLAAQDEDDGRRMTAQQLRDEVMTLFLAGHDTTALVLTWTFYLLSQHSEAAAQLRDELRQVLAGRDPGPADLPRLPYAEAVIAESMRLYPPAWVVGRQAIHDCVIGGYHVPKGTVVLVSQWTMHRDPRYYDDPEAFRPERWLGGLAKRLPKYAYFPFGGGPRVCIGNAFAAMEAALVLTTIAQRFQLDLAPGHPVETETYFTLRPKYGMKMVIRAA